MWAKLLKSHDCFYRTNGPAPALHKISQDSFKDTLLEYLKKDPYVVVFAEHTVSFFFF